MEQLPSTYKNARTAFIGVNGILWRTDRSAKFQLFCCYVFYDCAAYVRGLPFDGQIDTNLMGSIWVIRTALPHFRAQGGGHIPMIDAVEASSIPRRLVLGSDAYQHIRTALVNRLEALDAQRAIALASELPA